MKTKGGFKNRISIAAIAFAVLLAFLFAGTVLYAYFSADKVIDGDISSVPNISVDISTSADSGAATVFKKAGDKFTASVTVTNQNTYAVSYNFRLTGIDNLALRDALILSLDGKTLGTLSKCTDSDGNFKLSEEFLLAPSEEGGTAVKESRSHELSLELHLGAGDIFSDAANRVALYVTAKSFVDHNYLFVTNRDEFLQAIRPETLSGSVVKTVYLAKNIDLSQYNENTNTAEAVGGAPARTASDVVISEPVRIELNGKTLTLNTGLFLTSQSEMPSAITSAFSGGAITFAADNANGLVVDMPNSFVSFGENGAFAENFSVSPVVFASIDEQKLADAAAKYAAAAMKEGLTSKPIDILGGFGYYASSAANRLTVSVAPIGLTEISQSGNVCKLKVTDEAFGFLPENFIVSVSFTVAGRNSATAKASAKLLSNESLTDAILREFNAYFYTEDAQKPGLYTINPVTDVRRDLYLPTRVRSFNATVEWLSSDEASFSNTGKYRPSMDDQRVTLTAIVSFEGARTKREFNLNVLAFSAAERLKLMLAEETVVFTKSPDSRVLSFDAAKYKLENLTYRIEDADSDYLDLKKEISDGAERDVLHLKSSPSDSWTTGITVTANAAGGGVTVSATLKVTVKIERSVSIIDEANRYAQTYLPVGNTFISFPVPSEYNELVSLEYTLPSGDFTVGGNRYANAANVGDYIAVSALDAENKRYTVRIDATKVPTENTTVYLRVKYIYGDEIDERVLSFGLSGILHHNDDEISDFSLYIKLLNAVDANGDLWLTRDEADAANVSELKINNAGITSLKGIEYFRLTGTLDLAYNRLSDIDALSGMYDLKSLNLSYNLLSSVTALKNCTSLTSLNLSNNLNLSDVSPLSGLTDVTELLLHSDSSQSALSDISCIRNMKDLKTLRVYNTGVSSVMENNRNAILTAYFHYFDNHGTAPDYYITASGTKFTLSASTVEKYRAANDAINDLVPIYEFSNVIYLPPTVNGYDVAWNWYPSDVLEKTDDNRFIVHEPLADINAVLSATVPIGVNSERILRSFSVVSRGDNAAHGIQTTEGGSYLAAESLIPDSNLRYLLFKEFDTDGNKMISYQELIRKVDSALSFNNQNIGSLKGIEYFTGITNLNLSDNPFTDITPLNALNLVNLTVQNGKADLKLFEPIGVGQADSAWKYTLLDFYGTVNLTDALVEEQLLHIYNNHLTANGAIYKDNKYASGVTGKEWKPYDDELKRVATNLWGVITLKAGESKTLPTTFTWKTENDLKISYTKQNVAQTAQSYNLDKNIISLPYHTAPSVDVTALLTVRVSYTEPVSGKTYNVTVNKFIYLQTDTDLKAELPDGSLVALNVAVTDSTARRLILQATGEKAKANGNVISREMLGSIKSLTFVCDSEEGLSGLKLFEGLNLENLSVLYGSEKTGQKTPLFAPIGAVADTLKTLSIQRTFADLTELPILPNLTTLTLKNCPKIVMTGSGDNAAGVFDQTVSEPKFPVLTTLDLNSNYITSASPLIGLRKVTKLTFYDNPSSKSALTDAVIAEIFENLTEDQKAEFAYYIVTSDILWKPNSSVANTITEAGAKFADGTAVSPEIDGVNYVANGDALTLPSSYTANGATYSVEWKTDFTDTVTIGNGTATFRNSHDAKAYVKITASFPLLTKTIDYYFVVSGSAAGDRENYVNFDLFEEVDKSGKTVVSDPYFTYYCYELLNAADSANTTGLYRKSVAEGIAEIAFSNTLTTRNYAIKSLKGIENFTGLSELKLNYNTVTDLSPIKNLASLRVLEVMGNEISSLYLDDGVTSVFKNLTALSDLKLAYNNNIEDYKPVVYASVNGNSKTLRTGLSQLKTLFLVDISSSASTWNSELVNASDWVLTLSEWLGAVSEADGSFRGVTMYTVISYYNQTIQNSDALKRLKGSCAILLGEDIPDVYVVTKDANNNFIVPNIIKSVSPANDYLYTVDYTAVTAAGGDFISVGADSITLKNVDKIGIGGKMILRATVYVNATDFKVYKEIELDTSILNDNEQLSGLPLIEVTGEEKTVYLNFYNGLTDSDFNETSDGTFRISADKLIPDYAFSRYLYTVADKNADKILSVSERSSLTSVRLEKEGVRDISGFELFPNASYLHLWDNRVERISDFPALPYASQSDLSFIAQDDYLKDISGLLTLKDGARYRVVSFSLNSCGAFGQWNADILSKLPLTSLSLTATGITDYSFLTEGLNKTLETLSIGIFDGRNDHNYPIFEDYYGYREALTRVLFETGGAIGDDGQNKGLILTGNNKSTIAGFDASETYLYPYLNAVKNVKKDGKAVALDQTFQAFGKTYQVRYALPSGSKLTLNGYNLTVPTNYSGSSFTLIVQSGIKNADGTTTWTFTQETPFYFGASAEENTSELLTDGYVYDASAADNRRKLSDFVPDTGLRTVLLAIFDTNKDGTITEKELKDKGSSNISLTVPASGDLSFISPVPISSFEGIGFFSDYFTRQLTIFGANTTDLSPLSELVNVTYLSFNATNYIYLGNDANNHSNITDWSFLSGMKKLTTINLVHTNSLGTNLEAIVDSLSLTVFSSYNDASLFYYSTVSNAIAYGQSANNISDYLSPTATNKNGNLFYGTRKDQKRASIILNSLAIEDLLKDGSRIFLKDVADGSGFALPSAISFEGTDYRVEYIPLSTNISFDASSNTMTAKYVTNYTHAKFVARIYMDGALYERMLEFDVTA